jgi:hypothetical protein
VAGKGDHHVVGLAIMLALVLGVASTALARTGVGTTLDLGKINTVDAVSKLVGSVTGPGLKVDNNSTEASATALDLQVEPGRAPMKVNSDRRVANLNADNPGAMIFLVNSDSPLLDEMTLMAVCADLSPGR